MPRIFSDNSLGTTATTHGIVGQPTKEPTLQDNIVNALGRIGVSTGPDLAAIIGVEMGDAFDKALAALLDHGIVVRHTTPDALVYVVAQAASVVAGQSFADASTYVGDGLQDDVETLEDLLGPPSWRYDASTPEQFVQRAQNMKSDDASAWISAIERGGEILKVDGDLSNAPAQVRRLSALTRHWPEDARKELNGSLSLWAGLTVSDQTDFSQQRIISLPSSARAVAVAGPGAGKTFAIQQRIVHLLEAGLSPTTISVIAFSRTAVAELLMRVPVIDGEVVDIRTIDSIAGLFVTHATEDVGETDYEETVRQATTLIARDDRIARRWIDGHRNLIVDEAQDVVGARRKMLTTLIGSLPPDCGVTVFGDPAQAIHDYRAREPGHTGPAPMDASLTKCGFERHEFHGNHRTSQPSLRRLARKGREIALDSVDGHTALSEMRRLLYESSDGPPPRLAETRPVAELALFRTQAEAASHAARLGEDGMRVRLADADIQMAPAWLGRAMELLQGRGPDAIEEVVRGDPTMPTATKVAEALAVAIVDGLYDTGRMAEAVLTGQAPVPEPPIGQVASTIHAAKGREALDVELHLPEPRDDLSDAEAAEEARVLYVGATRARRHLYVAPERGAMRVTNKRHWRSTRYGIQVQLKPSDASEMTVLAQPDGPVREPLLRWRHEGGWGVFAKVNDDEVELARFSEIFDREIASICASVRATPFIPVARGRFRVDWHTIAREDGLQVVPVTDGFVWLNFKR